MLVKNNMKKKKAKDSTSALPGRSPRCWGTHCRCNLGVVRKKKELSASRKKISIQKVTK